MDVIIAQDLANLRIILSWLAYVDLGFDLAGVMQVRHLLQLPCYACKPGLRPRGRHAGMCAARCAAMLCVHVQWAAASAPGCFAASLTNASNHFTSLF